MHEPESSRDPKFDDSFPNLYSRTAMSSSEVNTKPRLTHVDFVMGSSVEHRSRMGSSKHLQVRVHGPFRWTLPREYTRVNTLYPDGTTYCCNSVGRHSSHLRLKAIGAEQLDARENMSTMCVKCVECTCSE